MYVKIKLKNFEIPLAGAPGAPIIILLMTNLSIITTHKHY